MTHNPIRSKWSLGLIALASRPQGTNTYECAAILGGTRDHASNNLKGLSRSGHLHCVQEDRSTNRLNQYFVHGEHAVAWKQATHKQNAAYRDRADAAKKNHKKGAGIAPTRIQSKTWARTPMPGKEPAAKPVETHGLALGWDCRYQMAPEEADKHRGPWGSLPIGRYPE